MTNRRQSSQGEKQASHLPETKAAAVGRAKRKSADASDAPSKGGSASAAPDYEVGYRKPPRHTQFQKGQPRPPRKPRPEVEPSFEDYFDQELRQPMKFVDETGKEQVMPKGQVLAKASVNKALKSGDIRQIKDFIPRRPAKTDTEISHADLELVARYLAHKFGKEFTPIERDEDVDTGTYETGDWGDDE